MLLICLYLGLCGEWEANGIFQKGGKLEAKKITVNHWKFYIAPILPSTN